MNERIAIAERIALYSPTLRISEAASFLGIAPKTLRNWRSLGKGPASVMVGSRPRYRLIDLERWVRVNTVREYGSDE